MAKRNKISEELDYIKLQNAIEKALEKNELKKSQEEINKTQKSPLALLYRAIIWALFVVVAIILSIYTLKLWICFEFSGFWSLIDPIMHTIANVILGVLFIACAIEGIKEKRNITEDLNANISVFALVLALLSFLKQ